jgi:hypothetical protein
LTGGTTWPTTGTDLAAIRSALGATDAGPLTDVVGSSVAVLGGSVADGLGNGHSDIEIYVAIERPTVDAAAARLVAHIGGLLPGSFPVPATPPYRRIHAASRTVPGVDGDIDITVFDSTEVLPHSMVLREQCLTNSAGPLFGHPPGALLRALHALNRGQTLWGEAGLESLQTTISSDFYPLLMMLFALDRALDAWRDLHPAPNGDGPVRRLDASQRFAQAGADAVVAWYGRPNPDDRWRLASLRRLEEEQPDLLPWSQFYDALFPTRPCDESTLRSVVDAVRALLDRPLVCTYPQAQQLVSELPDQ